MRLRLSERYITDTPWLLACPAYGDKCANTTSSSSVTLTVPMVLSMALVPSCQS